ncbi:arsenate reductase, partial [Vibrio sp. 10N.286.46.A8]
MTITMFGIPNCDTIKKAKKWLEAEGIEFEF